MRLPPRECGRRTRRRDDLPLLPRRPLPQPDVAGMRRVPRELARARPRKRVERARVCVRGGVCQHLRRVRAMQSRHLQARARERDVRGVPGEHQHDGGGARGAGGVPVRAGLLLSKVHSADCDHICQCCARVWCQPGRSVSCVCIIFRCRCFEGHQRQFAKLVLHA